MPMPKKDFGITMREAEKRTKQLTTATDYPNKEAIEQKAEPLDESDIICHYYTGHLGPCPGAMGDERHYVIKEGKMVLAHKRCHNRDQQGERKTPNVLIK